MIRSTIALASVFCVLLTIEASGIWVFSGWFALVPLMTTAGILVMQRVGIAEGVAWLCMLALIRGDIVAVTIAGIGPSLTQRVFSTRSLYALLGIGLISHAAGIGVLCIVSLIANSIFHASWNIPFSTLLLQELFLIPCLYLGMNIVRWFELNIHSRIALKPLT